MFTPILIALTIMALYLQRLTKHDKILFQFCLIRREIMSIFRKEGFSLSKSDYAALKELVVILNNTIHNYEQMKTSHFSWKGLALLSQQFKKSVNEVEEVNVSDNARIEKFKLKITRTFIMAFLTHTPFIKPVICLTILIWLLTKMSKLGISKLQEILAYLNYICELRTRYEDRNGTLRLT